MGSVEAPGLVDVLRDRAADGSARVTCLRGGRSETVSLADLVALAARGAAVLAEEGVRRGQVVPLLLDSGKEFLVTFLALVWAGAIPVCLPALDTGLRGRTRSARLLQRLRAPAVVMPEPGGAPAPEAGAKIVGASELLARCATAPAAAPARSGPDDVVLLQFSSGTGGEPKELRITNRALAFNLADMIAANGFGRDDRMVTWLPVFHDMGLVGTILCPLFAGMSLVTMRPRDFLWDPFAWLWALHRFGGTATIAPNFAYALCARLSRPGRLEGLDLSRVRVAINGAELVIWASIRAFHERFAPHGFRPEAMVPAYGLAENTLAVSFARRGQPIKHAALDRAALRRGVARVAAPDATDPEAIYVSVGPPIPHTPCLIRSTQGDVAPPGAVGRVMIAGECLAVGPELAAVGDRRYLDTGDVGFFDDEGDLYLLGRDGDVINRAGEKFYPEDVEAVASALEVGRPGRVAAFGVPDQELGTERLVMAVEVRRARIPGPERLGELQREIYRRCGLPLSEVVWLEQGSLPVTTSGKLSRSEVRARYQEERRLPGELGRRWPAARSDQEGGDPDQREVHE